MGKISRLPEFIREQVNRRLADAEPASSLLPWLNSLPETQALLQAEFDGRPINEGNLSEYRKSGFRKSQIQRAALDFCTHFDPSSPSAATPAPRIEQFVQWICLRLAAIAESSDLDENPQNELRDIRNFLNDIVALRRGELMSRRIGVEEERIALLRAKKHQDLESQFWQWTKRPDIHSKLYPHHDPDSLRRNVVRMLDRELLGISHPNGTDPEPDPAACI
jgi:hypothetical protein